MTDIRDNSAPTSEPLSTSTYFFDNPYCKALENARDIECKSPHFLSFKLQLDKTLVLSKLVFWL